MSTTTTITNDDIEHGEGGECSRCPVALALARSFSDHIPWVVVDRFELIPRCAATHLPFAGDLPFEVGDFITRFDELFAWDACETEEDIQDFLEKHDYDLDEPYEPEYVEPFSFELEVEVNDLVRR